ncbi:hypothetical protein [Actinoplanes sp. NPDC051851]|uniref:hypothetical protein n=1 Tax=Actinoplanes sp. NPDC051851 TaxID=3154753 RepID=UPI003448A8E9
MTLSEDQLRAALRAEASAHQPDREAMLARITSAAIQDPAASRLGRRRAPSRGPRVRLAVVTATVVAIFGGGGFAQWALAGGAEQDDVTPAPPPTATTSATPSTAPSPTDTASAASSPTAATSSAPAVTPTTPAKTRTTSPTATATPAATLTKGQPGFTRVSQGPLWSDGSVDPDSGDTQGASIITLTTTEELTRLTVTVRVAATDGLASRGATKSVPGASVSTSVTSGSDAVLYTFTLSSADTVAPGTYTFTAKYSYPSGGRNAGGDTYEAVATSASGTDLDVYGNFYAS